jgi:hypothetical protein
MLDLLMWPAVAAVVFWAVLTVVLGLAGQLRRYWWVSAVALGVGAWTLALMLLGIIPAHLMAEQWLRQ